MSAAAATGAQLDVRLEDTLRLHTARLGSLNRRGLLDESTAATVLAQLPELIAAALCRESLKLADAALAAVRGQAALLLATAGRAEDLVLAARARLPVPRPDARVVQGHGGTLKSRTTARHARRGKERIHES